MTSNPVVQWWKAATEFLSDVRSELKNVSWPSRKEVRGTTVVVIIAVFIFGIYLAFVDAIVGNAIRWVFSFFGGAHA